jgi:SnoaL-like domain
MSRAADDLTTAKVELYDLVTRMFVYTDRRRFDDLSGVFADQVTLDWTALFGGEPATVAGAEVGGIWQQGMAGWKATQHLTGNVLVDIEPDPVEATISVDAQATHYLPDGLGQSHWVLGCYYDMRARRTDLGWRLTNVTVHPIWATGNRDLLRRAASP